MDYLNQVIESVLEEGYKKLFRKIPQLDELCKLAEMFSDESIPPEYEKEEIQAFYLVKYFPAYLYEFYELYDMLKRKTDDPLDVLSVGAGYGTDFFAFQASDFPANSTWNGIDLVKWEGCQEKIEIRNFEDLIKNNEIKKYNTLIFPKSSEEICRKSEGVFDVIFKHIEKVDKFNMLFSFVSSRGGDVVDNIIKPYIEKYKEKNGTVRDYAKKPENVGIAAKATGFKYPDIHIDNFKRIKPSCKNNGEYVHCVDCELNNPVLKYNYRNIRRLMFERE